MWKFCCVRGGAPSRGPLYDGRRNTDDTFGVSIWQLVTRLINLVLRDREPMYVQYSQWLSSPHMHLNYISRVCQTHFVVSWSSSCVISGVQSKLVLYSQNRQLVSQFQLSCCFCGPSSSTSLAQPCSMSSSPPLACLCQCVCCPVSLLLCCFPPLSLHLWCQEHS